MFIDKVGLDRRPPMEIWTNDKLSHFQAGLTLNSLPWENMEKDVDDYIEEFYSKGLEEELVEPSHFQGLFLLIGILISTGLGNSL